MSRATGRNSLVSDDVRELTACYSDQTRAFIISLLTTIIVLFRRFARTCMSVIFSVFFRSVVFLLHSPTVALRVSRRVCWKKIGAKTQYSGLGMRAPTWNGYTYPCLQRPGNSSSCVFFFFNIIVFFTCFSRARRPTNGRASHNRRRLTFPAVRGTSYRVYRVSRSSPKCRLWVPVGKRFGVKGTKSKRQTENKSNKSMHFIWESRDFRRIEY